MKREVRRGYEDAAPDLITRFEEISTTDLLAPVRDHLPETPSRVLDVGAGTGRDAAWFASRAHAVVAVEPVDALRTAGRDLHRSASIKWLNDSLPDLSKVVEREDRFDVILLSAVWQHLDDGDRQIAFPTLRRVVSDCGKLIISIRHGAGAPTRRVFPTSVSDTLALARENGFSKQHEARTESAQDGNREAGVTWTWLVLRATGP